MKLSALSTSGVDFVNTLCTRISQHQSILLAGTQMAHVDTSQITEALAKGRLSLEIGYIYCEP